MATTVAFRNRIEVIYLRNRTELIDFTNKSEYQSHFTVAGAQTSGFTLSDGKLKMWDSTQNISLFCVRPGTVC